MSILFISDLHLNDSRPEITKLFGRFLEEVASQADTLYILGDLFEVWLGDDMILPEYRIVLDKLGETAARGVNIYIMYGNRDFLMRDKFEQSSGTTIIHEPYIIDLFGTRTLLLHGDTLCTDDLKYQEFRKMVRDPRWQADLLSKSPEERLALARHFREVSKTETAQKTSDIMDVNQQAVEETMKSHDVTRLIHGHTHRPAVHDFQINGSPARRFVLADWYRVGSYLLFNENGYQVKSFS